MPILIHGGRGLPPIGDHLAALVDRYADVRLIIAHAGIADLGGLAGHFAHVPGVFFDTSLWSIVDLLDLMRQVAPAADPVRDRLPVRPAAELAPARAPRRAASRLRRDRAARDARGHRARDRGRRPASGADRVEGPEEITHTLPLARIHQYIGMATPLLWMRQPDGRRPRPRAQRRPRGERRRRSRRRPDPPALSVASELWTGIGEIEDRHESERIARPARQLVHIADILAVTTPGTSAAAAARSAVTQHCRGRALDERREHRPLPRALRVPGQPRERVGRVERPRDVGDAGGGEREPRRRVRAAATETSGNENACRSPVRR